MKLKMSLRTVPINASKLAGCWVWKKGGEQCYILKINTAKVQAFYGEKKWAIRDEAGRLLALVDAWRLCKWVGLDELYILDAAISMRSASIAIASDDLNLLIKHQNQPKYKIEENFDAKELIGFVDVEIITQKDGGNTQFEERSVFLKMPAEALIQKFELYGVKRQSSECATGISVVNFIDEVVCLEVGAIDVDMRQIAGFQRGSLLLIPGCHVEFLCLKTISTNINLQSGDKPNEWMVVDIRDVVLSEENRYHSASIISQIESEFPMSIDGITVNIKIQLTQAKIKSVDLKRLEPGAIVVIETPADLPVDLLCNEVTIAKGCLVELDGQLAVEILSICELS